MSKKPKPDYEAMAQQAEENFDDFDDNGSDGPRSTQLEQLGMIAGCLRCIAEEHKEPTQAAKTAVRAAMCAVFFIAQRMGGRIAMDVVTDLAERMRVAADEHGWPEGPDDDDEDKT